VSTSERPAIIDIVERPINELSALRDVQPPPALVAKVMTQLSEPRLPSMWQWLHQPFPIELKVSPLALITLTLVLGAAFVVIGATLR
jgi:hypothetical protein